MGFVRGMSVAAATSLLIVGGMVPALAQSSEVCGPYTDAACDEPDAPEEPEVLDETLKQPEAPGDPDQPEVLEEAPELTPEAGDTAVSGEDETSVLGIVLARTGVDAWVLALAGALAVGVGVVALRMRRGTTDASL